MHQIGQFINIMKLFENFIVSYEKFNTILWYAHVKWNEWKDKYKQ